MEEPKGRTYDGPSGVGRDSFWLTAEDLIEGKDQVVKIVDVVLYPEVTFMGGRKRLNMLGLKFEGKGRVLGLNATNRKSLNKMFGNVAKAWKGQTITLYVADTQMAGEAVKCVRIRNAKARAATAAEDFLNEDQEPTPAAGAPVNGHQDLPEAACTEEAAAIEAILKDVGNTAGTPAEANDAYTKRLDAWRAAHVSG